MLVNDVSLVQSYLEMDVRFFKVVFVIVFIVELNGVLGDLQNIFQKDDDNDE